MTIIVKMSPMGRGAGGDIANTREFRVRVYGKDKDKIKNSLYFLLTFSTLITSEVSESCSSVSRAVLTFSLTPGHHVQSLLSFSFTTCAHQQHPAAPSSTQRHVSLITDAEVPHSRPGKRYPPPTPQSHPQFSDPGVILAISRQGGQTRFSDLPSKATFGSCYSLRNIFCSL